MTSSDAGRPTQPTRLVARAMGQFLVASSRAWARPHGGDLMAACVFCTMLSANVDHIGYEEQLAAHAASGTDGGRAARRPVSAHAIAASLSLPYETVRRRVAAMIADGRCMRSGSGVIVRPETLMTPSYAAAVREVAELLDTLVAALRTVGFDLGAIAAMARAVHPAAMSPPPAPLVARIVLDSHIRSLDTVTELFGDIVCGYICTAIMAINMRDLHADPEMTWRYAAHETMPPDELRRPVPVRELAREVEMPFETVRRHVRTLIGRGIVTPVGRQGVIVPTAIIADKRAVENQARLTLEFMRMIGNLARAGYRFEAGSQGLAA